MTFVAESTSESSPGDLTEDALFGGRLKFRQPRRGFRVTIDAPLLVFAALRAAPEPAGRLLDIGCGVGSCGLAFLLHRPGWRAALAEIQPEAAALAGESAAASGIAGAAVIAGDINDPAVAPGPFDLILSNPPYVPPEGHQLSPVAGKNLARFELTLTLGTLQTAMAARLAPDGRALAIVPAARAGAFEGGPLAVAERTLVSHVPGAPAVRAVLELRRAGAGAARESRIAIYEDAAMKRYTPEFAAFLAGDLLPAGA